MKSLKSVIRNLLPRFLHHSYNRIFSKSIIHDRVGAWFEIDWKDKAATASNKDWVKTYDESWKYWTVPDLAPEDLIRIAKLVPPGATVLDVGCGDGYLLNALVGSSGQAAGVDLSMEALKQARKRLGQRRPLVQAFMEALPFKDNAFDVVVTAHTLEHVRDLKTSVRELKRVALKQLIILVPSQEYLPYTEDYHLHFFPEVNDLVRIVDIPGAACERYANPPGSHKYGGYILLLNAEQPGFRGELPT